MNTELQTLLSSALINKEYATVRVKDVERIAGDDWLLEVCAEAQRLNAVVSPEAGNVLLALVKQE